MPCNSPLRAFQVKPGAPVSFSVPAGAARVLELPCGRCQGCRLERSRQDAVRCVHEAQMHQANCFITLTYDDEHLPPGRTLVKRDWVLFMKRLRKRVGIPIRFFMCGEYGEDYGRPHFHACLFGLDFPDREYHSRSGSGATLYRSPVLESLWRFGFSTVGELNYESAAYVARYVMKKQLGADRGPKRVILDVTTGELVEREHEFSLRSLKPGIGRKWIERYCSDVYPHGSVVMGGVEVKPPRYYDLWFESQDPAAFEALQGRRMVQADKRFDDNSPRRLVVKEQCLAARVAFLKRGLS